MNRKNILQPTLCVLISCLWVALPAAAEDKGQGPKKATPAAAPAPKAATKTAVAAPPAPVAQPAKGPETTLERVAKLVADRKAAAARRAAALAGAGKHLSEAAKAQKKYGAAVRAKKPGKEAPAEILAAAGTEDAAAAAQANEATQAGTQIETIDSQLSALVKTAEDKVASTQAAADAAKLAADEAKKAAAEAKKVAQLAKVDLAKAKAAAGLGSPQAFESRRKRSVEEIEKLKAKLQASGSTTAELAKQPPPAAATPAAKPAAPAAPAAQGAQPAPAAPAAPKK